MRLLVITIILFHFVSHTVIGCGGNRRRLLTTNFVVLSEFSKFLLLKKFKLNFHCRGILLYQLQLLRDGWRVDRYIFPATTNSFVDSPEIIVRFCRAVGGNKNFIVYYYHRQS